MFGKKQQIAHSHRLSGRAPVQVTTGDQQVDWWMLLRRARARAGAMAPERSPTVGRTIVIVTCPFSDQGQMSSFSA
eukprot:COSAG06_NODE_46338_length_347_cov_1.721774_1_plen_75_part_01